ncbi:MAG: hypothetical protein QG616_259 [Pseudomonadota bacterium]|nr:hypothetical protein [Pseudomonadota bacterium]MDQ5880429.1 hypothetical protein [Pseudomonadota bacterium]MDQ5903262.1 hypothetical protein [Pseudomonadota bacterium]MDQ5906787.1 hypothetical protein [Pseudomonadota bacterium]MDQ5917280.1 hypothetical protein [Pseudomonadota bacterium]
MANNCGEIISDPVPDHPLLNGRPEIGRGENTIVLDGDVVDGQARVFKVLSSPTDYAYYTAPDRPTGRHFPLVFADHGTIGRSSRGFPFHIVEVEKLYPLPAAGDAAELATKISTSYFDACMMWRNLAQDMGRIALHHLVVTPMGWNDTVQESLKALESFSGEYDALPDLIKADNLMMRKDGTLVFSDPVFME